MSYPSESNPSTQSSPTQSSLTQSSLTQSSLTQSSRSQIREAMQQCRASTLKIFASLNNEIFRQHIHPDFSPVGWHLGHIGHTEALWLLQHCAQQPPMFPQYHQLYAADGLPKNQRIHLPTLAETCQNLELIRQKVLQYLEIAPIDSQERLWRFIVQHESQHCETILFLLQLQKNQTRNRVSDSVSEPVLDEMIEIPAGEFAQGSNAIAALDNERPRHLQYLPTYYIDRYPVSRGQYRQFIGDGGYQNPEFWSKEGWQWRQAAQITEPLYWTKPDFSEIKPVSDSLDRHPVCGVSWYEAEAYSNFVGKRIPTEAEWEKAACWNPKTQQKQIYPWGKEPPQPHLCNHNRSLNSPFNPPTTPVDAYPQGISPYGCYDMMGNAWEWTASKFAGYPGFEAYPYPGYSMTYFDNQHQVLRGGSCVTRPWVIRGSFRNWYHPWIRQIFVGFRCAK